MNRYDFTLVLQGPPELTTDLADRLFAAGCDDGSPGMCCGSTVVDFHREAESLEIALRSAIAQVSSTGCLVERVEIDAENIKVSA
jgi:hypothetical protein